MILEFLSKEESVAQVIEHSAGSREEALSQAKRFVEDYPAWYEKMKTEASKGNLIRYKDIVTAVRVYFEPKFISGVPAWVIKQKSIDWWHAQLIFFQLVRSDVIKETDKAVQVEFTTIDPQDDYIGHKKIWVAKSLLEDSSETHDYKGNLFE